MDYKGERQFDSDHGVITFITYRDGVRLVNHVTEEAMDDFFGSDEGDPEAALQAFDRQLSGIIQLAAIALDHGRVTADGGALLTSEWLRSQGLHEI